MAYRRQNKAPAPCANTARGTGNTRRSVTVSVYIYGLIDPRTGEIRYVGKTTQPHVRKRQHVDEANSPIRRKHNTHKSRWIRALLALGLQPHLVILKDTDKDHWIEDERLLIRVLRANGARLTNLSLGGEGVQVPHTPEWHAKIGAARRGQPVGMTGVLKMRANSAMAKRDHCKNGHPYTPDNTRIIERKGAHDLPSIVRQCLQCRRDIDRRSKDRKGYHPHIPVTHCKNGRPYSGDNLHIVATSGTRDCKTCRAQRSRDYRKRCREREPITSLQVHPQGRDPRDAHK